MLAGLDQFSMCYCGSMRYVHIGWFHLYAFHGFYVINTMSLFVKTVGLHCKRKKCPLGGGTVGEFRRAIDLIVFSSQRIMAWLRLLKSDPVICDGSEFDWIRKSWKCDRCCMIRLRNSYRSLPLMLPSWKQPWSSVSVFCGIHGSEDNKPPTRQMES